MKEISVGLIGSGEVAQNFHLPILKSLQNVKLLAIADRVKSNAKIIAQRFDIPIVCDNIDDLVAIDSLDAIIICTPNALHTDMALKAIKAKKAVFIEKPIAPNLEEANIIHNASLEHNVKVMVGMNHRFRYDARMLKNYVQNGELGDVMYVKTGWLQKKNKQQWKTEAEKAGGGVFMDLGLPLVDSMLWIYNFADVHSVHANLFHRVSEKVEDLAVATINFMNGSVGVIECAWAIYSYQTNYYFNIYGRNGSAQVNPLQLFKSDGDILKPQVQPDKLSNLTAYTKSFEVELKHFISAVQHNYQIISSTDEAIKTMKIMDAFYQSAREGREIILD